jgi:hypothetical protein
LVSVSSNDQFTFAADKSDEDHLRKSSAKFLPSEVYFGATMNVEVENEKRAPEVKTRMQLPDQRGVLCITLSRLTGPRVEGSSLQLHCIANDQYETFLKDVQKRCGEDLQRSEDPSSDDSLQRNNIMTFYKLIWRNIYSI